MPFDLLIRGGNVVLPDGVVDVDVAVEDGTIVEIGRDLSGGAKEEIDAAGLHVFPGVIDPHVHFNEPGRTDWEGFDTGTAALSAGGGTLFFDMPLNSTPPVLDAAAFDDKVAAAEQNSRTDFALWGGLTPDNLDKLQELADRGVVGFKAFMSDSGIDDFHAADEDTLLKGMKIAAKHGVIVAVHAENENIIARRTAAIRGRGGRSWDDYLDSRPIESEVEAIAQAINIARWTECKLHVVHVSSSSGVEQVYEGILGGADVTCETCPHYLMLTEEDLRKTGPRAKCAPPLRPDIERQRLGKFLAEYEITFVASDHSPAPPSMKTSDDAFEVWGGISGVQSTLPALLTLKPSLPLMRVAGVTSRRAAEVFEIEKKGRVEVGFDADFAIVDVWQHYELTRDMLLDRHKLSPYVGRTFRGLVKRTIVRGHTVFRDGKSFGDFRGRLVTPRRAERA